MCAVIKTNGEAHFVHVEPRLGRKALPFAFVIHVDGGHVLPRRFLTQCLTESLYCCLLLFVGESVVVRLL